MEKKAKIKNGGVFRKGMVVITNVKKNGEEGDEKVYTISGKVKVEDYGDKYILHFNACTGGGLRVSSKGTVSGGSYNRRMDVVVTEYEIMEEEK
jgi:hypothetical protein